jgi:uncharacterized protein YndB with AHSA1/START domain
MSDRDIHQYREMRMEITISAPPLKIWEALTDPIHMKKWMSDEEIMVITDWKTGGPISVQGELHQLHFVNTGTVLQFDPGKVLRYSHLSSLSNLPDIPQSYSVLEFRLTPSNGQVILTLILTNFPTESIYKHLLFYWETTLKILKKFIEDPGNN